ncbi:MarR family transcriptional regulator [Streptomyces alboniger]|uniref:MarR family transcriptional regulator n=1 Tax=Streptomyces alboniger TaxID=132473 RepID=A0A5J6HHP5_STRAD|nr:MarR family transcriptional regulator [Streptomyces alboniger]
MASFASRPLTEPPWGHGKLTQTAHAPGEVPHQCITRLYKCVRYFSGVTTSQTNSPRDHLDVSSLISAIENFNRFYIRLPALQTLSFTTLSVLDTLTSRGPTRLTKLAETEQISQPGVTQLITRLEHDGLVERRPDPTDGRAVLVHITDAGRQVGASRLEDRIRRLVPLVAQLAPEDQRAITEALPALSRLAELGNQTRS